MVTITGVRLARSDGKILLVFAKKKCDDDEMEASGQLPAVKQEKGELPGQALQRLFRDMLHPLAKETRIEHMGREDLHEISPRYQINTTYIRVVYTAALQRPVEAIGSPVPLRGVTQTMSRPWKTQSTRWPTHGDCFLLGDRDNVFVCGWVDPIAENSFRSSTKTAREWIRRIDTSALTCRSQFYC